MFEAMLEAETPDVPTGRQSSGAGRSLCCPRRTEMRARTNNHARCHRSLSFWAPPSSVTSPCHDYTATPEDRRNQVYYGGKTGRFANVVSE